MECLLHKAGYPTTANGHFSAADAQELAKFRKSVGLNPLLVGGRRAWSALLSRGTTPHLQAGDKGKNVLRLQLALRSAGFAKIPTKGRYGAATAGVIKVVQKSQHLKRTGEVNAEFWKRLASRQDHRDDRRRQETESLNRSPRRRRLTPRARKLWHLPRNSSAIHTYAMPPVPTAGTAPASA